MKIIFMGTPDFALKILEILHKSGHEIAAVYTQPDKPKGRGYSIQSSPVKIYAESNGLQVFQPKSLRGIDCYNIMKEISPDFIVVAAYGNILPKNILDLPKFCCLNVHGSVLPKYRGAAPIQRAIMNGEKTTGVTIMQMDEGIDTGDVYSTAEFDINNDDNFETVHDKIAYLGGELLVDTIEKIVDEKIVPTKQDNDKMSYAPKIEKSECAVNFTMSADDVHNHIRGLSPFPLAYAYINGKILKFVSSSVNTQVNGVSGTVVSLKNGVITIACGENSIDILSVIPEGKKKMSADDYINGRNISVGDVLCTSI